MFSRYLDQFRILVATVEVQALGSSNIRLGLEGHIAAIAVAIPSQDGVHGKITSFVPEAAFIGHHLIAGAVHDECMHWRIAAVGFNGVIKSSRDHGNRSRRILSGQPNTEVKPPPLDIPMAKTRLRST